MNHFDRLESRMLLDATLQNGVLTITGTAQDDRVVVYSLDTLNQPRATLNVKVFRYRSGTTQIIQASRKIYRFSDLPTSVDLVIDSRGGDDQIEVAPAARLSIATINTGAGDDQFAGGATFVRAHLGDGNDTMSLGSNGSVGHYRAFGQGGNDIILGTSREDVLDGGDGDDRINGADAADIIRGGAGDDILEGEGSAAYGGSDLIEGGDGNDELYGRVGDDTLDGGAGNDALFGGRGIDRDYGGADDDDLDGGSGNDKLYGNAGNDDVIKVDTGKGLWDDSTDDNGANALPDDSSQLYP